MGTSAAPRAHHQIGEVAERLGLSLRTIRYYEEVGLAKPSERSPGGFRLYSDEDIDRLKRVVQMKPLGLSLETMRELLDARERLERGSDQEALDRLASIAAQARKECERLRVQLEAALTFSQTLERDLRRHRRRARGA